DRIVGSGPPGRAADHLHAIRVGPDVPDPSIGDQRLELEMAVDHHVERDVDRVAIVAAQVIEPTLHVPAGHGKADAAGAAERANHGGSEHRTEIDSEHAETEQQPIDDLAAILRKMLEHVPPTGPGCYWGMILAPRMIPVHRVCASPAPLAMPFLAML